MNQNDLTKYIINIDYNTIGVVYCAFNIITNKIYIGYTQRTIKRRIIEHFSDSRNNNTYNYFHNSLSCYGKDNFIWYILFQSNNIELLTEKEKEYISLFNSNNRYNGYNLTSGGEKCNMNEEVRKKYQ
jgi:group I intron endonuclease